MLSSLALVEDSIPPLIPQIMLQYRNFGISNRIAQKEISNVSKTMIGKLATLTPNPVVPQGSPLGKRTQPRRSDRREHAFCAHARCTQAPARSLGAKRACGGSSPMCCAAAAAAAAAAMCSSRCCAAAAAAIVYASIAGLIFQHFLTTFLCFFGLLPRASTMSPTITVIHGSARRFSQSLEVVSF